MNMETTSPSPPCDTLSPSSIDSSQNTGTLSTNTSKNSCKHCRESHRKCDRTLPQCVQCTKRGLRCIYEPSKKRRSRAAMAEEAEQQSQHHQQPVLHHSSSSFESSSSSSSSVSPSGYELFEQQAKMAKLSHPINNNNNITTTTTGATNTTAANHHYLPSATIMAPPFPPPSHHHHNLSHHHEHQHSHHHHNHHPNHQYFQPQLLQQPSYLSQQPPQIQLQLSQPQPQQQQQQQQVVPPPLAPPQAPSLQQMVSHPNFNLASLMKMSGQHQDASTTTTSIVPSAQSTVSLPSPSTISGSAISAMMAPNSGSLNDVLNLCFQILPTEHRSSLTAQFLWGQSSNPPKNKNDENDGIVSVNSDREAEEELDRKAGEAMWFASQAVLLQHLPSSDPHRFIDLDAEEMFFDKMCEKIFLCFQLIDRNNTSGVSGDSFCESKLVRAASSSCMSTTGKGSGSGPYAHLMRKFTREQLLDAAQQMYRLGREILLDPKVFPHISNHFKFAQSCSFLVFYLLSVGNEQSETHVFLKAVKVFMDRAKGIVEQNNKIVVMNEFNNGHGHITRSSSNGNISTSSVDSNEEAEYQCLVLDHMADGYLGLKVTLFNDTIAFNKIWIRKFIKLSLKALDARKTEAHFVQVLSRHQAEALKKLKKLLSEINGTTLVHWNKFISTCREIRLSVKFHDKHPQTIWNFFMLSFEMYALQAVCTEDNGVMPSLLSTMQVNLANEISEILIGNITLSMVAGSRLRLFLEFVARVHIAHAEVLCRSISATKEEMEDALKYLRMDALIVDVIRGRHNNARCKELHKLLHQHMVRHTMTMGRQYDPNWHDQMAHVISKVQMDQESKLLPSIDNKANAVLSIQDSDFSDQGFLMELFDMDQDFLYLNDQYNN